MSYNLRKRNQDVLYIDFDSDSESDSCCPDPDYARKQPRRDQDQDATRGLSADPRQGYVAQMASVGSGRGRGRPRTGRRSPRRRRSSVQTPNQGDTGPSQRIRSGAKRAARPSGKMAQTAVSGNLAPTNGAVENTIMSLLLEMETVKEYEEVFYYDRIKSLVSLHGRIWKTGIFCTCCRGVMSVSEFQLHAATGETTAPYHHVVLGKSKRTLTQCQVSAWYKRLKADGDFNLIGHSYTPKSEDKSDDACIVCADGGDLICCSECTLTYHMDCLYMKEMPDNNWVCPCCLCAHCGLPGTKNKNITECNLCGKTYHLACHGNPVMEVSPLCSKFCGDACAKIDGEMKKIAGVKNDLGEGFSWTLIHHYDLFAINVKDPDYHLRTECNSKVALAWDLMNRAFEPVIDRLTEVNILKNVIFNTSSTLSRINFKGFYTAVLQKGEEVVAAATIRMRGARMAEMPFVATDERYRNQRMLSRLMAAIVTTLSEMDIEYLVIPSAEDVQEMWINKFRFEPLSSSLEHDIMLSKTLMFPNSVRLQKNLTNRTVETKLELEPEPEPEPEPEQEPDSEPEPEPEPELELELEPQRRVLLPFDLNLYPEEDPLFWWTRFYGELTRMSS